MSGGGSDTRPVLVGEALDERIAIVGTAGSGKTYAAKGFVERLLDAGARIAIVDPLGVWWGLRASADGAAPGYPVIVFGGRHADVPITAEMGAPLGRLIATEALACVVDLSELGSATARRRFMAALSEALYEANEEPLHLVLDEADLWAPQRPIKGWEGLLGHIEEIVRRGRVRGFIPWLITQRPAVVHKDVLSQADILIAMKLTASQDRDAIGAWIEGQADRQEGKRILGALPRLRRGEGYLWAPGHDLLDRVAFPAIRTFDSSRTPKRGERLATPRTLAEVDLTAITAALAAASIEDKNHPKSAPRSADDRRRHDEIEQELAAAKTRIAALEEQNRELRSRLSGIAALAGGASRASPATLSVINPPATTAPRPMRVPGWRCPNAKTRPTAACIRPRASCYWRSRSMRRRASPGARRLRSRASNRGAGISTPAAKACAPGAISKKPPASFRRRRPVSRRPAMCLRRHRRRPSASRSGAAAFPLRRPRCCASWPRMASALWMSRSSPACSAKSRTAVTGIPASPSCATTA
jgi:Helicase HerA, central domain